MFNYLPLLLVRYRIFNDIKYKKNLKNLKLIFVLIKSNKVKDVNYLLPINCDNLLVSDQISKYYNNTSKIYSNQNWLLYIYLSNISYYYLNIKLNWRFVNILNTVNKDFLLKFWYKIYKKKIFNILYGKKKRTITWFLQLYKLKDPQGCIFIIQKFLTKVNLKRHKKFFFLIGKFFKILFITKEKKNSLRGFSLYFKGKLGKKGSVRKSKFFVKYGVRSLTNKNLRINYKTWVIITITGVVGCNICLYYE